MFGSLHETRTKEDIPLIQAFRHCIASLTLTNQPLEREKGSLPRINSYRLVLQLGSERKCKQFKSLTQFKWCVSERQNSLFNFAEPFSSLFFFSHSAPYLHMFSVENYSPLDFSHTYTHTGIQQPIIKYKTLDIEVQLRLCGGHKDT